jgi:hypothetical protein
VWVPDPTGTGIATPPTSRLEAIFVEDSVEIYLRGTVFEDEIEFV